MSIDQNLNIAIECDELVIRIGIETLVHAFEHSPDNQDAARDYKNIFKVTDPKVWAKDVCQALCDEEEDGSTVVTRLFDSACMTATESGSLGIEDPDFD